MKRKNKNKKELEILLKTSKEVSASLDLDKVGSLILRNVKAILKTDYSALFLLDEESKRLMLIGAQGFKKAQIRNLKILASWERINVEVLRRGKAIIVNDISQNTVFKDKKLFFFDEKLPLGAFLAVPLKTNSKVVGILIISNHKKRKDHFTDEDKKFLYTLGNHVSIALLNARLYKGTKDLFLSTVRSLVTAVDAKDPYTHGHSERVSRYAVAIGKELKLSKDSLETLALSGLMHDVGKIGVSDTILSKKTKLNKKEMKKIHEHPNIGLKIVESVMHSDVVLKGIEQHHEYFNGKGYPKKLKGEAISREGRIIAIADVFDSITTDRPYHKALGVDEAARAIKMNSGTQFDPKAVKAFQQSFRKYPDIWRIK